MSRGANSKPNKGFLREIEKNPQRANAKKPFDYSKPITPQSKEVNGMHTPHRLREFKSVKSTENFTSETTQHQKNRRGEK